MRITTMVRNTILVGIVVWNMNGFTIKCIAVLSMLIDHVGYVLFPHHLWMRAIGRIAFPIYCFLLMEGYRHTRDAKKYLLRLGIFALISEIPFNLAFSLSLRASGTNVFFTLFLGLLAAYISDQIKMFKGQYIFLQYIVFLVAAVIAELLLDTDYGAWGILLIFVFYAYQQHKVLTFVLAGAIFWCMTWLELFALFAFIPIFLYNGRRGPNPPALKIGFYLFYPLHLLALYFIFCSIYGWYLL